MISYILPALLFIQTAAVPAAPSLTGAWTINGEVQGVTYTAQCTFTQTGPAITGTCGDGKTSRDVKGKVDGDKITFTHDSTYNDEAITMNYTGKLDPSGKLTGSVEVDPYSVDGTFTGTRSSQPPSQ